ncbi:hypothetical protein PR048_028261 [Dryococelus australis]|uniref:Uncharacterized protein n=1 Tax=Dryococelus australis TaxID=614101 RepID=A0ABQ9GIU0_9NEOP|nr:hypothetical protein PR048_028261 [Dryococelus australis]
MYTDGEMLQKTRLFYWKGYGNEILSRIKIACTEYLRVLGDRDQLLSLETPLELVHGPLVLKYPPHALPSGGRTIPGQEAAGDEDCAEDTKPSHKVYFSLYLPISLSSKSFASSEYVSLHCFSSSEVELYFLVFSATEQGASAYHVAARVFEAQQRCMPLRTLMMETDSELGAPMRLQKEIGTTSLRIFRIVMNTAYRDALLLQISMLTTADTHCDENVLGGCSTNRNAARRAVANQTQGSFSEPRSRLARSPPTKANRVQFPAGSPDFRKWESCRTMPLAGGFSRGYPVSPAPSFRCRSIFTSITLIGSQDLAVMSRPKTLHFITLIWVKQ